MKDCIVHSHRLTDAQYITLLEHYPDFGWELSNRGRTWFLKPMESFEKHPEDCFEIEPHACFAISWHWCLLNKEKWVRENETEFYNEYLENKKLEEEEKSC